MFVSEEHQIAERIKDIVKKSKKSSGSEYRNVMLRDGRILRLDDYPGMVNSGKVNPQDAYIYIWMTWTSDKADFFHPFLARYGDLLDVYLSKLGFYLKFSTISESGFYSKYLVAPATGLKYIAYAVGYGEYLTIEVSDLDIVVNNLNLRKIVYEVVGDKLVSGEKELTRKEYEKIDDMFRSQGLFAGYDFEDASGIIHDYYDDDDQWAAKEVARIAMDYYRIFQPYRVCYETKTWKELDCLSVKLD